MIQFILHARNYYVPKEQRQILRIILMPPVYAIVSFFSYRFFRAYTYYQLVVVVYESLVLAAFLMLLLQFIGESDAEQRKVLLAKEKRKIPIPFCCIRFRPSKPYFLHALKWSVLQYSLLRPLISLAGVITNAFGVLCPTQYSVYFAEVYLDSVDFVSISVALYGLIVFYALVKERLAGKQPLLKFLSIKGIVMITFYQSFLFSILQDYKVIKATAYWTAENVADGLQALCTCCEMVIFSLIFLKAFSHKPYKSERPAGAPHTSVFWAFIDSINYSDFVMEGWYGIVFTVRYILGRPGTHSARGPLNIEDAFQGEVKKSNSHESTSSGTPMRYVGARASSDSDDEGARGPYHAQPEVESSLPSTAFRGGVGRASTEGEAFERQQQQQQQQFQRQAEYPPEMQEDAEAYERRTAAEDAWARQQQKYGSRTAQQ
ncbi:hypothetical protein RQP46_004055 [Phenoliferia psychrophenolica]